MTDYMKRLTGSWQDGISLILGIWLFFSPWLLGFAMIQGAMWNAVVFGVIIFLMSLAVLIRFHDWEEWIDGVIGVWLVISPWVLGFTVLAGGSATATANFVIVGLLVLAMAAWSLIGHHREVRA